MIARALLVALALVLGFGRLTYATPIVSPPAPCVTATLSSYIALGSTGCSIGGEVAYADFAFAVLASAGGATPIAASDILVTPSLGVDEQTLEFSSTGFSVTGAESVSYLVAYNIDPHPILFGFRLELNAFSPVAPGIATVTSDLCIGAPFAGPLLAPTCAGVPASATVFHAGTVTSLVDSVDFGGAFADLGVRNTIGLHANGASADFTSYTNTVQVVPEPATWSLVVLGGIGALLRRRSSSR
jgi:hypothetical protein